jgi:hypothetical protein
MLGFVFKDIGKVHPQDLGYFQYMDEYETTIIKN